MKTNRILYFAAVMLLFLSGYDASASDKFTKDNVDISDVSVKRVGTILYISYDLSMGSRVKSCNTELMVSLDGGKTFSAVPGSPNLTGDLGKTSANGKKEVRYDINAVKWQYSGKDLVFEVRAKHIVVLKPKIFAIAGVCAYPAVSSYNIMAGYADKFGAYARVRTNFKSAAPNASYTCKSSGEIDGGGIIWATGNSVSSVFTVTAGGLLRVGSWFYPYIGVGYGSRNVVWEDSQSRMVKVSDLSYSGIVFEGGVIFNIGSISLSLGASNLASVNGFGVDAGIGFNF